MRTGSILAGALVACAAGAAAATFAAAQQPPPPASAQAQAQPTPPSDHPAPAADPKAILESACTSCHGLDFITEKRKDHADWEFTVNKMISRGADLNPDEAKLVIDYLAKTYPPADAPSGDAPKPEAKPGG